MCIKRNEGLSIVLAIVMSITLLAGMTFPVNAETESIQWTQYTGQTSEGNYTISSESDLIQLRDRVNSGTSYSGSKFQLSNNITLTGSWTPIGGSWSTNTGTPSGNYFAGVFDGNGKTISGLNVSAQKSGIGLFGYVNGGIIGNLTVSGTVTNSGSFAAVGGIVGYTNSSLVNCTSNVTVDASGCSNVGGLAGIVENTVSTAVSTENMDANVVVVDHCRSTKNVKGLKRVGGLIGSAYASVTGRVLVDGCSVTDGNSASTDKDISGTSTQYKCFIGGLIGYCEASVSNALVGENVTVCAADTDGHRMGGIAGILSGYGSAKGRLAECVFLGSFSKIGTNTSYDGAICVPEAGTSMKNCFYLTTQIKQKTSYSAANVQLLTDDQMKGSSIIADSKKINYYLSQSPSWNSSFGNEWSCGKETSPKYPEIIAEVQKTVTELDSYGRGTSYTGDDSAYSSSVVYYDGTSTTDGDGTAASPYKSFSNAVAAMSGKDYLCVKSSISVSDYNAAVAGTSSNLNEKTIARSSNFSGSIFEIGSGETLNLSNITIDGNSSTIGNQPLINVNGGSLTLGDGAVLTNNKTMKRGSAVRISSGSFTMNAGSISGNTSAKGGAVYVEHGSAFTLGTSNGIASDQPVYLDNTEYNDCKITLTTALSSELKILCANPVAGSYGTGTIVAEGADASIVNAATLGKLEYTGYSFSQTNEGSPLYIYISGSTL